MLSSMYIRMLVEVLFGTVSMNTTSTNIPVIYIHTTKDIHLLWWLAFRNQITRLNITITNIIKNICSKNISKKNISFSNIQPFINTNYIIFLSVELFFQVIRPRRGIGTSLVGETVAWYVHKDVHCSWSNSIGSHLMSNIFIQLVHCPWLLPYLIISVISILSFPWYYLYINYIIDFYLHNFWIRDSIREYISTYDILIRIFFVVFCVLIFSESLFFITFFWSSFYTSWSSVWS